MSDLNPVSLWKRFLALPNDSRAKALTMAFLVSFAAALAVSTAAVTLGPRLDANRAAEQQARLQALLADVPGLADVLAGGSLDALEAIVVDLRSGTRADGVDAASFDPESLGPDAITELSSDDDIAGIGTRPDLQRIFVARQGREVALVVLPVEGQGYQSVIRGYLALEPDLATVAGLTITEQAETPGLGANIQTPSWQALWPGTRLIGPDGEIRVAVVRGGATTEYEVDAITGATRTSNGVQDMIRFWIGPNGFGPVLDAIAAGEL